MKQVVINCNEIVGTPTLITLGDIQVDVEKISAYDSIRMLDLIQNVKEGNRDLMVEATEVVLDIVHEQNKECTEEHLLRAGNQAQLNSFILAIVKHTLETYAPITSRDNPLIKSLLKVTTAAE